MPLNFNWGEDEVPKEPPPGADPSTAKVIGVRHDGRDVDLGGRDTDCTGAMPEHEVRVLCSNLARAMMGMAGAGAMIVECAKVDATGNRVIGVGTFSAFRSLVGQALELVGGPNGVDAIFAQNYAEKKSKS